MELKSQKEYIPLVVHWDADGEPDCNDEVLPKLTPTWLFLEGGGVYEIDRVREDGTLPSFLSGGFGTR